jgi:hypothetical protein
MITAPTDNHVIEHHPREVHMSPSAMARVLSLHNRSEALTQIAQEGQQRALAANQLLLETLSLVLEAQGVPFHPDDRYTIDLARGTLRLSGKSDDD